MQPFFNPWHIGTEQVLATSLRACDEVMLKDYNLEEANHQAASTAEATDIGVDLGIGPRREGEARCLCHFACHELGEVGEQPSG